MRFSYKVYLFFLTLIFILAFDIASKHYIESHLSAVFSPNYPYGGIPVFRNLAGVDFCIVYATNTGAAWGIFSNHTHFLVPVRLALVLGLTLYLFLSRLAIIKCLAFSFIVAGALGNILDYLFYGHVIDMLLFSFFGHLFPVFNLADTFIFLGVVYLLFDGFFLTKKS